MSDYVTLLGADDVRQAGSLMRSAAGDMNRAANNLQESLLRHQNFMDDWLLRFEHCSNELINRAEGKR